MHADGGRDRHRQANRRAGRQMNVSLRNSKDDKQRLMVVPLL